jgi:hypothetical protein
LRDIVYNLFVKACNLDRMVRINKPERNIISA